jgi:hypothetical protein
MELDHQEDANPQTASSSSSRTTAASAEESQSNRALARQQRPPSVVSYSRHTPPISLFQVLPRQLLPIHHEGDGRRQEEAASSPSCPFCWMTRTTMRNELGAADSVLDILDEAIQLLDQDDEDLLAASLSSSCTSPACCFFCRH